jgi:hypothetical protein
MKYFLWPLLRAAAVVLLPVITVSGIVRAVLRGLTGADQVPPRPMFFLLQLIVLPLYIPAILIYFVAVAAYHWVVFHVISSPMGGVPAWPAFGGPARRRE